MLSYGPVSMDVNGDGYLDLTAWAGAQDGVLIWDKYMDGLVHDNSQYAFAQYATTYANGLDANGKAPTDLSGLAEAFDSNRDGVFDAQDAQFDEFKVWQDANQNGVSDAGEVRSLADWGIASINLVSDGVVRTPAEGVTEAGRTMATTTDGQSMLVADAAFAYRTATDDELAMAQAVQSYSLSPEPFLDLGAWLGQSQPTGGDWAALSLPSNTGANGAALLGLAHVLSLAPQDGLYALQLLGDVNDPMLWRHGDAMSSGNAAVSSDGGFSGVSNASAQWLIDQQIMTLYASS